MISDNEFIAMVKGLYEKSVRENVAWLQKHPPDGTYWLQLPTSVIMLQYSRPTTEPDCITFTLARGLNGPVLATRKVYEGDLGWDILLDLYALVTRKVGGWDNVWKDIQTFVGKANAVPQGSP
jgi:hypothetical protein